MKNPLEGIEAFPLAWPPMVKRTPGHQRTRAKFGTQSSQSHQRGDGTTYTYTRKENLTVAGARGRVLAEIGRLGGRGVVLSSNVQLRQDGLPMSGRREPDDPGVAVYFLLNNKPRCLPCDRWDRVADNFAAVAKFIDAMRGQIRWGVGSVEAMFEGFKALPGGDVPSVYPAAMTVEQAAAFVADASLVHGGLSALPKDVLADPEKYRTYYRRAAAALHPDRNGGAVHPHWHQLQAAAAVLDQHHGGNQ
jgi:hypothetical protein